MAKSKKAAAKPRSTKKSTPKAGDTVRVKIPASLRHQVLMEAGYKCARPVCHNIITLDLHHMIYVSEGGENVAWNLIPLCGYCHDMHHAKQFPAEAIRLWKGLLAALNQAFDRKSIDLLLFLTKQFSATHYSADGVLQFAGLIAAGLVQFGAQMGGGYTPSGPAMSVHQLQLSEKGKMLVEAWLAGDTAKYLELLKI